MCFDCCSECRVKLSNLKKLRHSIHNQNATYIFSSTFSSNNYISIIHKMEYWSCWRWLWNDKDVLQLWNGILKLALTLANKTRVLIPSQPKIRTKMNINYYFVEIRFYGPWSKFRKKIKNFRTPVLLARVYGMQMNYSPENFFYIKSKV